jgi:hypothetical protein
MVGVPNVTNSDNQNYAIVLRHYLTRSILRIVDSPEFV